MITKLSGCKRRGEKRRETMQVVRAIPAARELTRITSQSCKKKTITRRLWWRGWRMMMTLSVGLLAIKADAYTNKCGCPPSSTTCSSPQIYQYSVIVRKNRTWEAEQKRHVCSGR